MARLASAAFLLVLAAVPRAASADRPRPWQVYGTLSLEAAVAGTFYLNFSDLADHMSEGTRLTLGTGGSIVLPIAGGYLAHRLDLDPRPALALHGAAIYGGEGFLLGTLVDGRDEAWGLRIGRTAWTLGAVGLAAGAYLGATEVDGRDESAVWFAAPVAGFAIGGLGLGGILVIAGGLDGDHAMGQFTTGAVIGLGVGAGAATYLAIRGVGDTSPSRQLARVARYLPRPSVGKDHLVFTVAGRF